MSRMQAERHFGIALLVSSLPANAQSWRSHLNDELQVMGHRNWIL